MGLISNGSTVFDAGAMSAGFGGSMVFMKKLTASGSATLSFVHGSGGVDFSTYKEYMFTFNNIHPATNSKEFRFNVSIDAGSNYNVAKTTTQFYAFHYENNSSANLAVRADQDLAQGTTFQPLCADVGNEADECCSGTLHLFNPSSTTFVKHFISNFNVIIANEQTGNFYTSGYANTTSDVDAIQFKFNSGNIDTGDICLYGIA